jgi:hypothetical protein
MTKNPVAGPDVQIVARLSLARGVDRAFRSSFGGPLPDLRKDK